MSMQTPQARADLGNVSTAYIDQMTVRCKHLPDHHGTTTDSLDVPDGRVGGDGEGSVQNTGEDTREEGRVVEVAENLS